MTPLRWYRKLGNQLLLLIGLILVASAVAAVSLTFSRNYLGFQDVVYASLANSAEVRINALDRWIVERRDSLDELARTVVQDPATTDSILLTACYEFLTGNREFEGLYLMEYPTGLIRLSTNSLESGRVLKDSPLLVNAKSRPWVSPFLTNPETGRIELVAAVPVIRNSRTVAILGARLSLGALATFFNSPRSVTPSETAYLVAPGSRLILSVANRSASSVLTASPQVQQALAGVSSQGAYVNIYGTPVFGAYTWVEAWKAALLVEMPQSATVFSYSHFEWIMAGVGLVIALVLTGLGFLLSRRLVRPLRLLTLASDRIVSGDFTHRIPPVAQSEIAQTARAYNQMMDTIQNLLTTLSDREKYFRNLIEHSSDFVFVLDLEGLIRYVSPSASKKLGYPEADLLGQPSARYLVPQDQTDPEADGSHWLRSMTTHGYLVRNYWALCADGNRLLVEATFNPLPPQADGQVNIVINARDITDKARIEHDLEQRRKMDSLGLFSAGVADDFNNLLTGLMGYVSIFKLQVEGGFWDDTLLDRMEEGILRAKELTQRLIIISSGGVFHFQPMQITGLITAVVDSLDLAAKTDLHLHLADHLPPISCDREKIMVMLREIIDNALKFMGRSGSLTVRADLVFSSHHGSQTGSVLPPAGQVRVSIQDTGPGIAPQILHQVFDPYFTTHERAKGLGLAMAYAIMESHNGQIELNSVVGRGTEVVLTFPVAPTT